MDRKKNKIKNNMILLTLLFIKMNAFSIAHSFEVYNILDYGAKSDTTFLSTIAIQEAINESHKFGGGIVKIPNGKFVIGTIILKSNVTLYLEAGAHLLGSTRLEDYSDDIPVPVEVPRSKKCMIFTMDAKNVSIEGKGIINGRGYPKYFPHKGERPMHMRFINCNNILIKDVTVKNSAAWSTHLINCTRIRIEGVYFYNRIQFNNDGIDFDSCKDLFISNCKFDTEDDPICGKSTLAKQSENVVITNCIMRSTCSGFKLGTSSKGGFKNITISNCIIRDTERGAIKLICVDGGTMENINISDIVMDNVGGPIFIRLGGRGKNYLKPKNMDYSLTGVDAIEETPIGQIKGVSISNIRATVSGHEEAQAGVMITGIPGYYVEDITLNDITITFPGGGTKKDAQRIVPEDIKRYPEQSFFGILPSYGAYIRHTKNLVMNNWTIKYAEHEERPAIFLLDVHNSEFYNIRGMAPNSNQLFLMQQESNENKYEKITTFKGENIIVNQNP